ncbi:hypothetical protein JTE90_029014 [Oedothorax gibbosus]|uniref:Reverse transcriptase domain-containing protein n=1 Tax=Oedothorax gibbosus TaxID=931172 RepID=A0AAV6VHW8_9ARAC|nr:hypothetical protein JTE90_029014 [Oedothorax gibbosus]
MDTSPFTPAEIRGRLHKFENSAPGPDRLSYENLKQADPDCRIIARIFNFCLYSRRIPAAWKRSKFILIHKKDDVDDLQNWRPISLCNTLYKLYTGCLSSRLVHWLMDFDVLSFTQKGFLPFDGVFEHRYVINQAQTLAKIEKSSICMAQIDLTNAFGSIPHLAIRAALQEAGAGPHFTEVISDLYTDSTTEFIAPIPISAEISGCLEKNCQVEACPLAKNRRLEDLFVPAFVFHMRTEQLTKGDMKIIDDFIRPLIKDNLYLDESAAN